MRRRRGWRGTAVLMAATAVAAVLLSCQQQSPEQELIQKVEPVGSWLAALQMTGEKWTANSVPDAFVRTTVEAAQGPFAKAARDAAESTARAAVRDPLRQLISAGEAASDRLRRAAAASDRGAAAPVIRRLAELGASFAALKKSCAEPPR
jgi:hypothetical protein